MLKAESRKLQRLSLTFKIPETAVFSIELAI